MEGLRSVEAVQPVSTVDALAQVLRKQILDGTLRAGTQLREAEIATTFKVSRHTVRSALQVLVHGGLARHSPNRGTFVPEFTPAEIEELFRFREILELEAVDNLVNGDGDLAAPRAAVADLRELPADAEWGAVRDADLAVHKALISTLESERISRTFESLMAELRLSLPHLRPEFEHRPWVVRQHEDFLAALEAHDGERAAAWIRNHNNESITDIISGLAGSAAEGEN